MTDFQAILGTYQLEILDELIDRRIEIANIYDKELESINWLTIPARITNRKMVYQTYHILLNEKIDRKKFIKSLKKVGIETNLGAQAVPHLSFFKKKYRYCETEFPNSLRVFKYGLAIPIGNHLTDEDIESIVNEILSMELLR